MQGEDKKGRSLWQHPWLSSWLVSESPTCLATQSLKIETALYVFFKRACRCLYFHRPAGTHVYAAKTTVQSTERIWSRFGIQISFPRSELNHYPTNNQACLAAEHDGWGPRNDPQKGCYASWATVDPNPYPYHVRQLFLGLTFENFHFLGFQVLPENSTDLFDHQYP